MRVTTDLWVSALLRRVFSAGCFAAVVRRGAAEAGAVFVVARDRSGRSTLYGPAPQTTYSSDKPEERLFTPAENLADGEAIERRLERERRFDPDLWILEVEAELKDLEAWLSIRTP